MSFLTQLGSIFGGANPGVSAPDLKQSNQDPALKQSNQDPVQSNEAQIQLKKVQPDTGRNNGVKLGQAPQTTPAQLPEQAVDLVMAQLAQAPQASQEQPTAQAVDQLMAQLGLEQAPQAQSPEAQIKSLFATLDPMKAISLLMELLTPFMGMLGMGSPSTAEKPAQAQLGQEQAPANEGFAMLKNILSPSTDNEPADPKSQTVAA